MLHSRVRVDRDPGVARIVSTRGAWLADDVLPPIAEERTGLVVIAHVARQIREYTIILTFFAGVCARHCGSARSSGVT